MDSGHRAKESQGGDKSIKQGLDRIQDQGNVDFKKEGTKCTGGNSEPRDWEEEVGLVDFPVMLPVPLQVSQVEFQSIASY